MISAESFSTDEAAVDRVQLGIDEVLHGSRVMLCPRINAL
jgi:hypothetical protein